MISKAVTKQEILEYSNSFRATLRPSSSLTEDREKGPIASSFAIDSVIAYEQTTQAGLKFDVKVNLSDTDVNRVVTSLCS